MATSTGRSRCITCGKEKAILKCGGCTHDYCYNHFGDHRQQLNTQLEAVEVNRDLFRQALTEQTSELQNHSLMQQIDQWERSSINKIRQTAEEARKVLLQHTTQHIKQVEVELNQLTNQLRQGREENDFVETDLRHWNEQLTQLTNELKKPSNIALRQDSKPFVTKLYVDIATGSLDIPKHCDNPKWTQDGITVAGGNGDGSRLNQLSNPIGIYVDEDHAIYIAEYRNHRVVEWKYGAKAGQVVAGGNGEGDRSDQLNGPTDVVFDRETNSLIICDLKNRRIVQWSRDTDSRRQTIISNIDCSRLAMDNDGYFYVSNNKIHEVRRWKIGDKNGTVVAAGNGEGNRLDQLNNPTCVFVDRDYSVYVSDWGNNRVVKWTKGATEGIVVAGSQHQGSGLTQLSSPQGVIVDQLGTVYVVDYGNNRVMRWCKGATEGTIVVGGNDEREGPKQLNGPQGLSFDRQGNLYVVDQYNCRVQKFNIHSASTF